MCAESTRGPITSLPSLLALAGRAVYSRLPGHASCGGGGLLPPFGPLAAPVTPSALSHGAWRELVEGALRKTGRLLDLPRVKLASHAIDGEQGARDADFIVTRERR